MKPNTDSQVFLAGDIGGTNTNLALVRYRQGAFKLEYSQRYSTQQENSLLDPLARFLDSAKQAGFSAPLSACCVSGAGPVVGGVIQLTNAPWAIRQSELQNFLKIPTFLINDFTAVSYAVVLLDTQDKQAVTMMPHPDGSQPQPGSGMALVVGAGTGLGTGFIQKNEDGSYRAFASEGGHSELPCYDDLSRAFHSWMTDKLGTAPGVELAVSGQGIDNIFSFICSPAFSKSLIGERYSLADQTLDMELSQTVSSILAKPESERPALIAGNRASDWRCALTMEVFVNFYARKVSGLASIFLPSGGIYLAGGISSKNEAFLLENHRFMRIFEENYAPHIRAFLKDASVVLVRDYSISLLGAANAALQLSRN